MGMLIFVVCEVMFFAGLISGHTISRATVPEGMWPPPDQPLLPTGITGFNTLVLLASGAVLLWAGRKWRKGEGGVALMGVAAALGTFFVSLQGYEWAGLLKQGLTLTSSNYGAFFYLIVGMHAVHAVVAVGALVWAAWRARAKTLTVGALGAVQVFWLFVVAMWPVIYVRVYF